MNMDNMKPIHLLSQELNYELRIRGIVTERKEASQKRKMLTRLLERDRDRKDILLEDPEYNVENEKRVIAETVESIKNVISEFEGPESDSTYKRIRSRIIHITNRVSRVKLLNDDTYNEILTFKNESKANCLELEVLLQEKVRDLSTSLMDVNPLNLSSSSQPVVNNVYNSSVRSIPVYKWDIKFAGDKNLDLISFLERVEELRVARHVEKKDLYESAVDLFSGNALSWYRSVKNTVNDWDSLVNLLKQEFLPPDYVDKVWEQIRNRYQSSEEPIHIFVAIMDNLFGRLGHFVAESTKVKYVRKNLLPHYITHLALVTINSLSDLVVNCRKIDEAFNIKQEQNNIGSLVNDKNLRDDSNNPGPSGRPFHANTPGNKSNKTFVRRDTFTQRPSNARFSSRVVCWNCNQENHTFRDCKAKRNVFCFRCGNKNVTKSTCGCSKNIN